MESPKAGVEQKRKTDEKNEMDETHQIDETVVIFVHQGYHAPRGRAWQLRRS
jgi:5-deoxy-D-glucuronate isomerase